MRGGWLRSAHAPIAGAAHARPLPRRMRRGLSSSGGCSQARSSGPLCNANELKAGEEFKMAKNEHRRRNHPNEQGFVGTAQTNDEKTDKVEIKCTYGTWRLGNCATSTPLGSEALVEAFGSSEPLGTLNLGSNLKAELKTKSPGQPVYIYVGFSGGETCYFDFSKLKGTISAVNVGGLNRMQLNFNKQKLKLYKPLSGKLCPKKATITAPFAYQLTTETYYISYEVL